jgi:two-component system LytT family response regulator
MKAVIIDYENKARSVLRTLIHEDCPEITTVEEASDLVSGVAKIKAFQPDIVFLDIEMPEHSGLEIASFFKEQAIQFQIIFTTAYNQYAIEALKLSAIDYLLKPIDSDELIHAVQKAKMAIEANNITNKLSQIEKTFKQLSLNKIALEVPKGILFVSHEDIILFEADGVYTKVYLKNGKVELISKTLKHFSDQLLEKSIFYKPHRSYLINLKYMSQFVKKDGYHIVLENNKTIPVARDKKEEFLNLVQRIF